VENGTISGNPLCSILVVTILYVPRGYFSETHQVDLVRFVGMLIYAAIFAWAGVRLILRRRRGPTQRGGAP
jgi:uncharacterized membrane protein YfcA